MNSLGRFLYITLSDLFLSKVFSAVKAVIHRDDRFLVIKQVIDDLVFWDLPGGKIEFGESPYDTLQREVKEETGLDVEIAKSLGMWWFYRQVDNHQVVCNTFLCDPKHYNVDLSANPADEQITEYEWVTKEEFLSEKYQVSRNSLKKLVYDLDL